MMKILLLYTTIAGCLALTSVAQAHSAHDGSWDLVFVTQRGACDPTYNFSVNIANGMVTHPNLVRFSGYVARSGAFRAAAELGRSGEIATFPGGKDIAWATIARQSRCSDP